jgi:putative addiction module component (TIGR02574 family)
MNKALLQQLLQLTPAERIQLAEDLWDSISEDSSNLPPLTEEERAELKRRLEEHRRDPSTAVPWEEVRARLASRFK